MQTSQKTLHEDHCQILGARGALLLTVSTLRNLVHWGTDPPLGQLSAVGNRFSIVGNVKRCFLRVTGWAGMNGVGEGIR